MKIPDHIHPRFLTAQKIISETIFCIDQVLYMYRSRLAQKPCSIDRQFDMECIQMYVDIIRPRLVSMPLKNMDDANRIFYHQLTIKNTREFTRVSLHQFLRDVCGVKNKDLPVIKDEFFIRWSVTKKSEFNQ